MHQLAINLANSLTAYLFDQGVLVQGLIHLVDSNVCNGASVSQYVYCIRIRHELNILLV